MSWKTGKAGGPERGYMAAAGSGPAALLGRRRKHGDARSLRKHPISGRDASQKGPRSHPHFSL